MGIDNRSIAQELTNHEQTDAEAIDCINEE